MADRLRVTAAALLWMTAAAAGAHEVRPAYLQITESIPGERYDVLWKQPIVQGGRLPIDPVFSTACTMTERAAPEVTGDALIEHWVLACDLMRESVHISGLSMTLTDVLVRVERASGTTATYILRPEQPTLQMGAPPAPAMSYLIVGIEHLLFGIDHVLFVIGLFLFVRGPWLLLKTVTAFTVAHSITLALSVLGVVQLRQGPVEAVIALSILFLARELLQDESRRSALTNASPWIMAFIFGLLHGLGFAGALRDIGLPEDTLWLALLLFNVGLEIGQLLVIAAMVAAMWLLRRIALAADFTRIAAWAMGCLAAFWTIDRTLVLL